jgi:hypothetical protein
MTRVGEKVPAGRAFQYQDDWIGTSDLLNPLLTDLSRLDAFWGHSLDY